MSTSIALEYSHSRNPTRMYRTVGDEGCLEMNKCAAARRQEQKYCTEAPPASCGASQPALSEGGLRISVSSTSCVATRAACTSWSLGYTGGAGPLPSLSGLLLEAEATASPLYRSTSREGAGWL